MTDPTRLSAVELSERLRLRDLRAVELVAAFRERIERLDGELNAFLRLNPRAEAEAAEADRRLDAGRGGPLTGIPIAVKDNLATAGLETTCGSRMLGDYVPQRDATAVARIRGVGAVILGKTNCDEFGMGSSTENSAYGPTRNPWDRSRVPGGSSGGSAVAVAARMAPLALGSDTGGSVRQPAAFCGVVGLKPTYGLVSRYGLVAFGSSLDQVGPLARSVDDTALLLERVRGDDAADMTSRAEPAAATDAPLHELRIGLPREYLGAGLDPEIATAVREAADELERRGSVIVEVSLPRTRYAIPCYYLLATAEASSNLARFDGVRYGHRVDAGGGLRRMYRSSRGAGLGVEVQRRILLGTFALSAGYHDAYYGRAQQARSLLRADFQRLFDDGLHLLLTPTTPSTAFRLGEKLDDPLAMYLSDVYTVTPSLAGLPALSVPVGTSSAGLPIGVQLIGPPFGEPLLLRAGAAIEPPAPLEPPRDPSNGRATRAGEERA
jgi:aspartyl-tRNA(Asn)/glutamyl-tRNA(Gln) amidotransferase subunit A